MKNNDIKKTGRLTGALARFFAGKKKKEPEYHRPECVYEAIDEYYRKFR